jgi:flagellar biosynthesis component FlhA
MEGLFIDDSKMDEFQEAGYICVTIETFIITLLREAFYLNSNRLFNLSDLKQLFREHTLDETFLETDNGIRFFKLIQLLLIENIPLENLPRILDLYSMEKYKNLTDIATTIRREYLPLIFKNIATDKTLYYSKLPEEIIKSVQNSTQDPEEHIYIYHSEIRSIIHKIRSISFPSTVFIVPNEIRFALSKILRTAFLDPSIIVLTKDEVHPEYELQPLN